MGLHLSIKNLLLHSIQPYLLFGCLEAFKGIKGRNYAFLICTRQDSYTCLFQLEILPELYWINQISKHYFPIAC
jgi:hypothetical protein